MMLRKSASVVEYSPPSDSLLHVRKQTSVDHIKGSPLEEEKFAGITQTNA